MTFKCLTVNILFVSTLLLSQAYAQQTDSIETVQQKLSVKVSSLDQHPYLKQYDWFRNQQTRANLKQAVHFIALTEHHGLEPEDYHLQSLQNLLIQDKINNKITLNHHLTENLVSLIHDLKNGRFEAKKVDHSWHIEQSQFNAYTFLQRALTSGHFLNYLKLLLPKDSEYQVLINGLKRYKAFAKNKSWPLIPATPLLRLGDRHPNLKLIQHRLAAEDRFFAMTHFIASAYFDPLIEQAVRRFQMRYGLKVDGIIGPETLRTMNIPAARWVQQIKVNLERRRWLPTTFPERYLLVNIANFSLSGIENGQTNLTMKVIVGRKSRQTPSFSGQLNHMVFNPYWNVPKRLARLDLLPRQQEDPSYFTRNDIKVFTVENSAKIEHDPTSINWQNFSRSESLPYVLRQEPGLHNALGQIKFLFPNPWSIYLHDTFQKSLFNEHQRAISSGCIRVEKPIQLANFALPNPAQHQLITDGIASQQNKGFKLPEPLSIFAVYFTVFAQGNQLRFTPDIYQRDESMIKTLY